MLMPYTELKTYFERFHVGEITRTELIGAIGLFQRMNQITTSKKVSGFLIIRTSDIPRLRKFNYFPRNISPRIIGINIDAEYEFAIEKKRFYDSVLGERF